MNARGAHFVIFAAFAVSACAAAENGQRRQSRTDSTYDWDAAVPVGDVERDAAADQRRAEAPRFHGTAADVPCPVGPSTTRSLSAALQLPPDVAYVELRHGTETLESRGWRCSSADRPDVCAKRYLAFHQPPTTPLSDELDSASWNETPTLARTASFLLVERAGAFEAVASHDQLMRLLTTIDSLPKAVLLAGVRGYQYLCPYSFEPIETTGWALVLRSTRFAAPHSVAFRRHLALVGRDGSFTVVRTTKSR